eukprot:2623873-Pyramimonas_sp.AAC.1
MDGDMLISHLSPKCLLSPLLGASFSSDLLQRSHAGLTLPVEILRRRLPPGSILSREKLPLARLRLNCPRLHL